MGILFQGNGVFAVEVENSASRIDRQPEVMIRQKRQFEPFLPATMRDDIMFLIYFFGIYPAAQSQGIRKVEFGFIFGVNQIAVANETFSFIFDVSGIGCLDCAYRSGVKLIGYGIAITRVERIPD